MTEPRTPEPADEGGFLAERREKLERLRAQGVDPFPHEFAEREEIGEVRVAHEGLARGWRPSRTIASPAG